MPTPGSDPGPDREGYGQVQVLDKGHVILASVKTLIDGQSDLDRAVVQAARASTVSGWEGWSTGLKLPEQDAKLLKYLWTHGHHSPWEHVVLTFHIKCPIMVSRQWMRHRTWCLHGDTKVTFERPDRLAQGKRTRYTIPIERLYRNFRSRPDRYRNMLLRVYDEGQEQFTTGHIKDVLYSGRQDVYTITLANGKQLSCTENHRILTTQGWQRLKDAVGLEQVNNRLVMTKEAGILCNGKFVPGQVPWNKGKRYQTGHTITEEHKEQIRQARSGEQSNFWKGGISSDRAKIGRWTTEQAPRVHTKFDYTCQHCFERGGRLHAHHVLPVVDHPDLAYDFDNLITLCDSCHSKEHGRTGEIRRAKGVTLTAVPSRVVRIEYEGKVDTYDIEVEGPHHNFVANGVVVHNSYNEQSGRYQEYGEEFYVPSEWRLQSKTNTQGSSGILNDDEDPVITGMYQDLIKSGLWHYQLALRRGVAREQARLFLPAFALYTEFYGTVDVRNLINFIKERSALEAQWEIRQYSDAIKTLIRPLCPQTLALAFPQETDHEVQRSP